MKISQSSQVGRLVTLSFGWMLLLVLLTATRLDVAGQVVGGGGFLVYGRVYLPDGSPAVRVKVKLDTASSFNRETLTDNDGYYEFRGIVAGRYHLSAINRDAPEQFTDPADTDSTRAYANRLQVNLYLRLPLHDRKEDGKAGTISATEAAQNIPKAARQAYEQGLRQQKANQNDKALLSFNQALGLFPAYVQALTERGNLYMQQNHLAEAAQDFEQALQINGQYSPALRGAGYCNLQQGKHETALAQLEKSLVYEPKIALTHMLVGYANLSLNRYEPARLALQEALKLGMDSVPRAHVYLAEVLAHEEKFKEAADEIRAYLRAKPDAADSANLQKLEEGWRAQSKAAKKQL
jgi:tetratricopeptide (TPR) repeat protein